MEQRNDFADIVRSVITHTGEVGFQHRGLIAEALALSYLAMHPTSEWTFDDITDEVRAEAPHLVFPQEVRFYFRVLRVGEQPLRDVDDALESMEMLTVEHTTVTEKMVATMKANPDGRIAIHSMISTKHGMHMVGAEHKWRPTKEEFAVLDDALRRVAIERSNFTGEVVEFAPSREGRVNIRHHFGKVTVEGLVAEAAEALADDDKIISVVDAWAADYDEGR